MPHTTSPRRHLLAGLAIAIPAMLAHPPIATAQPEWRPAKGPLMTQWAADVSPRKVHPEYPRPQFVREKWVNLNGLWQFAPAAPDEPPPLGKDLPGRILVPFPVESALSGVMERHERLWYRTRFTNPLAGFVGIGDAATDGVGPTLLLHFGAVDFECEAYVNGKLVGRHRGGYDPFTFDITRAADTTSCELIVGVSDPTDAGTQPRGKQVRKPEGIFYTSTTGIWQTVWLEEVPAVALDNVLIHTDIETSKDHPSPRAIIQPVGRPIARGFSVEAVVLDQGKEVGRGMLTGTDERDAVIEIPLPGAKLWSPESPFLYDVHLTLRRPALGNRVVDEVTSYFAMRKISLGKDEAGTTRILLNNKPYFAVGTLDQGFWPDGLYTAPTDEAMRYDLEQTKRLGFNMIRKHVKVEPDRWYTWCDKLGILVWQDMPSGDKFIDPSDPDITRTPQSAQQHEAELRAMFNHLQNHPCIVMWVVFNEGWGQYDTPRIVNLMKRLDPSRLVDNASGWTDRGVGDVIDMHEYPGPGAPKWEPSRAAVLGEFGGLGLRIDGHTWAKDSWGYQGMADQDELTDRYISLLRGVYQLRDSAGLCAAVYTQTTDVETECNGLMTYDRAVLKVDADRVAAANRGVFPGLRTILATAQTDAALWRYTTAPPNAAAGAAVSDWFNPGFDDSTWPRGASGFGTPGTPGTIISTKWDTTDIWIRRPFELPGDFHAPSPANLRLLIHHDEDAEVYLNGVLAARLTGYTTAYGDVRIQPAAAATLKPGKNSIAVHCKQTRGGQYIDAGLIEIEPPTK
jgi:hypothetical protein